MVAYCCRLLPCGRGRTKRAPELFLFVCTDLLRAYSECAVAVETMLSLIRFIHRRPYDPHRIWSFLDAHVNQPIASTGARSNFPIWYLLDTFKVLAGTLSGEGVFSHPAVPDVVLYHVNLKKFVPLCVMLSDASFRAILRAAFARLRKWAVLRDLTSAPWNLVLIGTPC